MTLFQLFAALFGLFMLYVISIHRRKSQLSAVETSFWYTTWVVFVIIAMVPDLLLNISDALQFQRVFDLLVVGAFMVLTLVLIFTYLELRQLKYQLEKFIREKAISDANRQNKKE